MIRYKGTIEDAISSRSYLEACTEFIELQDVIKLSLSPPEFSDFKQIAEYFKIVL